MSHEKSSAAVIRRTHGFEFGGPLGVLGITIGLPILCYLTVFLCNDVSGCPIPSLLHPITLTWKNFARDAGWPEDGIWRLADSRVTAWVLGYYGLSVLMQLILQGEEFEGVELRSGARLKYKFNAFNSAVIILTAALVGTLTQGPDFGLWTFINDNYLQILSANLAIAFFLACFVYVRSFSIRPGQDNAHRDLAPGGLTGNLIYDWFIGRELNPRVDVPYFGTIDIKVFCELRPGMLGWLLLDLAFMTHQYKLYGHITDSMLLVTVFQGIYILDALWNEPSILTTMDITTDGFGFMLAFGDLVWLPFIYSLQTRYLSIHPVQLGPLRTLVILAVNLAGYYIFRSANTQKHIFRTHGPDDPRVEHLHSIPTSTGTNLLVSGWWGYARHINYLGDWIMSWAWCLPTGVAGYLITRSAATTEPGKFQVTQDEARGWGMFFTYFYLLYFAVLLVHRERRDEIKCARKYGDDWEEYKARVPWRIVPGVY